MSMGRPAVGDRFHRLVVIDTGLQGQPVRCRCDCGVEKDISPYSLTKKNRSTKSCGCLFSEKRKEKATTHGMSSSKIYHQWGDMISRCRCETNKDWKYYGGRGITVCDRWLDFNNFFEDMGGTWFSTASIERKDNNLGYQPENCVWIEKSQQQKNRRFNRKISINGKILTATDAAKILGLKRQTLCRRLDDGWSIERAMHEPATAGRRPMIR
jgi:hypothetical protein